MTDPKPDPPRLLHPDEMPRVDGLRIPDDIYVACRSPALLAGVPRSSMTPSRLRALHDAGYRHVVRLENDRPAHDPHPLNPAGSFGLQDLCARPSPLDPKREAGLVAAAVQVVLEKLALGEGVVVHCIGGRGRTGTVIGSVLVSLGHQPESVARYLDLIQGRGGASWPESQWQADILHRFAGGGAR